MAKVHRDRLCETMDLEFPAYGFATHKGYPTAAHLQALCWQYLHHHGQTTLPQDTSALLALFRVPPQQQDHYALTLAQLLATASTLASIAPALLEGIGRNFGWECGAIWLR